MCLCVGLNLWSQCLRRPGECVGSPEAGVAGNFEMLGVKLSPLQKQKVLLNTESSFYISKPG